MIESGRDLDRWEEPRSRAKRAAILLRLRDQLNTAPPPLKRVPRRVRHTTHWQVGEVFALRLHSGRLTLFRVVGYHEDRGGRFARCEMLDWTGTRSHRPSTSIVDRLDVLPARSDFNAGQFMPPEPRTKVDQGRLLRTGIRSVPMPPRLSMLVVVWPHVDRILADCFGLE